MLSLKINDGGVLLIFHTLYSISRTVTCWTHSDTI